MYQVLSEVLKANGKQPSAQSHTATIQSALVFETIRTIAMIYPSMELLTLAAQSTSALLRSTHRNLKYIGIDSVMHITTGWGGREEPCVWSGKPLNFTGQFVLPKRVSGGNSLPSVISRKSALQVYRIEWGAHPRVRLGLGEVLERPI